MTDENVITERNFDENGNSFTIGLQNYGGVQGVTQQTSTPTGGNGKLSRFLAQGVAHKKEPIQLELFPEENIAKLKEREGAEYVDEAHRPIELTTFQKKLVIWLSDYISKQRNAKDIERKIEALNEWVTYQPKVLQIANLKKEQKLLSKGSYEAEDKEDEIKAIINTLPPEDELTNIFYTANNDIKRYVSYKWLSERIYGSARARELKKIEEEIKGLTQVSCVVMYGDFIGRYEPLITLSASTPPVTMKADEDEGSKGRKRTEDVSLGRWINFSSVFFYKLANEFAPITPKLIEILQKNGTELFLTLLYDLCAKLYQYRTAAEFAKKIAEQDIRGHYKAYQDKTKEQREQIIRKAMDKALTFSMYDDTIKAKINRDFSSTKQYRSQYNKLFDEAVVSLIEYGIILSASKSKADKTRGYKRTFLFNYDFAIQGSSEPESASAETGQEGAEILLLPEG